VTYPLPKDFEHHARTENDRELEDRYGLGSRTIKRLRKLVGIESPAARTPRDRPVDFVEHSHETNVALAVRYGVGEKVIRRWRKTH